MEESNKRAERGAPAAHLSRDRTGQCDTVRYCGLNTGPPVRSPGGLYLMALKLIHELY